MKNVKRNFAPARLYKPCVVIALTFLLIFVDRISLNGVDAQSEQWSQPRVMPGFDLTSWPPILIADQNRTVHAFSSQWVGEAGRANKAIVYNQWSLSQGWTNPIDILLSPSKEARVTDAYLDGEGTFHLVFWGGDNTAADIYYSSAHWRNVNEASAWDPPVIVAESAGDPEGAVLVEDDQRHLLIIYHGRIYGAGVYAIESQDGGGTWSGPIQIFLTKPAAPLISNIKVIRSESGWLHAIWNTFSTSGQGRGIYYARSKDGIEWSDPVPLATAQDGLGTQTPTLVEYMDSLNLIYNIPPKIRMRRSMDDGLTWSDLVTLFPRHVGVNGSLSAAVDSGNTLHLFFGQRITASPDIHGMWHSIWVNNRWTEPDAIVKGPAVTDPIGLKSFDPYEARAVVSQGNVILATWRMDPGLNGNGVWYSYKVLDLPEAPVITPVEQILPDTAPTPIAVDGTVNPDNAVANTPDGSPTFSIDQYSTSQAWSAGSLIAVGAVPVIFIILALIITRFIRNRSL